jgi:hypothetical protein
MNIKNRFNLFFLLGVISSAGWSIGQASENWEHFWVNDSMLINGSPALSAGISIRLSFVREELNDKQIARNLFVDIYGLPSSLCNEARILLTNKRESLGRPSADLRERLQIQLAAQSDGHCSANALTDSTFVDDPDASRVGSSPGQDYEYVLKDGTELSTQTFSLQIGRIPFLAGFRLAL